MFVVLWGFGGPGVVWLPAESPLAFVDEVVVAAADQGEVVKVGWAPMFPGPDVVGMAPVWRSVAAREDAALVTLDESGSLCGGGCSDVAALVENHSLRPEYRRNDVGVAGETSDGCRRDGRASCAGPGRVESEGPRRGVSFAEGVRWNGVPRAESAMDR